MASQEYNDIKSKLDKIKDIGNKGAEDAIQKAAVTDPKLLDGIKFVPKVEAFKKKPAGNSKISLDAVKLLLFKGGLKRTQKSIADELKLKYPEHGVSARIWQRPLPSYEWTAIQKRVRGDLGEKGDVRGCKTLSEVRKRLIAIQQENIGQVVYNVKIAITSDAVTIGKAVYPIEVKSTGKHKYEIVRVVVGAKRQGVRIDALEALLRGQ